MVIADTEVIAAAPVRFLAAGMGDAMATFYEARACQNNPDACNLIAPLTYRPPRIALAIAGACLEVLFCQGVQAKEDCEQGRLSAAVDDVSSCNPFAQQWHERACQVVGYWCTRIHKPAASLARRQTTVAWCGAYSRPPRTLSPPSTPSHFSTLQVIDDNIILSGTRA